MIATTRTVEDLKNDHPFAAGALARSLGKTSYYGCHFGMRSTRDHNVAEFKRGWEAAK